MKNNLITNDYQEKEINKILQDGIDKSLLYINSLNMSNFNDFSQTKKELINNSRTKKYSKTTNPTKNKITFKQSFKSSNALKNKRIEFKPFSKNQLKSKSVGKTMKPLKKMRVFDYQNEYNKKRNELEKVKNELIKERVKQNKLQKEMNSKIKKEKEFNKLEEKDNLKEKNSEDLIVKIQQSERIREEQTKIIERLLSEYNIMINRIRKNPNIEIMNKYDELKLEADTLKHESMTMAKKKNINKNI